jgi:PAS domain S-box-containing protein
LGASYVAVHLVGAALSDQFIAPDGVRALWHPGAGLALVLLLLRGPRLWWAVAFAVFLTVGIQSFPGIPPARTIAVGCYAVLLWVTVAAVVRHPRLWPDRTRPPPAGLVIGLCLVLPALYYFVGPLVATYSPDALERVTRGWLGQATAALAVVPFAMVNADRLPRGLGGPLGRSAKNDDDRVGMLTWAGITVIALAMSIVDVHPATLEVRTSYLLLIPAAWMALRYDLRGVTGAILIGNLAYMIAMTGIASYGKALAFQTALLGLNLTSLFIGSIAVAKGRALRRLRERETFYRLVADNSSDVIVVLRIDGTCEYVSPSAQAVLGLAPATLIGSRFSDVVHPDDLSQATLDFERAFSLPQVPNSVLRIRAADGAYRWVERTARAFHDPNEPAVPKLLNVVRDISERQQLEETLRQSQKLESVGRLAGGVAHDFNNLLTALLGHASLLEEDDRLPADVKAQVAEMRRASERAAGLTGQLLAFARRQVTVPKVVDLNELTRGIEQLLHRVLGEDVQLRTSLGPTLGRVRIDPGQMEQVLVNLAVNARDAMPDGGRLTIQTANRRAGSRRVFDPISGTGEHVEIAVTDTGHGMNDEVQSRIFEPFFTTKAVGKGTGLGLAVCHGIIREAGGRIDVESVVGHGTTFRLRLPVSGAELLESDPAVGERQPGHGEGEAVLVVEDEGQVRDLIGRVLTGDGYRVVAAASAEEALTLLRNEPARIEAILTDVVLPGISGPRLADLLRQRYPAIRILFMSGFTDEDQEARRAEWAQDCFLQKPFSAEVLRARVRSLLDTTLVPPTGQPRLPVTFSTQPALTVPQDST